MQESAFLPQAPLIYKGHVPTAPRLCHELCSWKTYLSFPTHFTAEEITVLGCQEKQMQDIYPCLPFPQQQHAVLVQTPLWSSFWGMRLVCGLLLRSSHMPHHSNLLSVVSSIFFPKATENERFSGLGNNSPIKTYKNFREWWGHLSAVSLHRYT